ncbi:MAG TPA: hypothetical protein VNO75_00845 [Gemmatimonadaceae bacterium]|nr:hypothetical protein [Gemmatimonadaceae bacterium]
MRWRPWLSAAGLSVYLCLVLWKQRTGGSSDFGVDLFGSCLIALLTVAIGWLAGGALTKDPDRRALIALIAGMWGLLFSTFQLVAESALGPAFQSALFAAFVWTVSCGGACWLLSRGSSSFSFVSRALGIATIILLGAQSVQAMKAFSAESTEEEPAKEKVRDRRDGKRPDVYVIVLDKYSSGAWLSHSYGVDHRPFEDSLRALGFVVPRAARANYAHTQLALASFLNWRYIEAQGAGEAAPSWDRMRHLIGAATTWDAFKKHGYRVVSFSTSFPATRAVANADVELSLANRSAPLGETWRLNSPLASMPLQCTTGACTRAGPTPYPIETVSDVEWKLKKLQSLSDSAGPILAFMHLLVPHEPYLFDADCATGAPWWPLNDQGANFARIGEEYAIQVGCLDRMLLRTVRSLLRKPGPRPVIVLQSDHGHGRITADPLRGFTLTATELSPEQLGERFGVFAAYTFPGADTAVYDDISAVNVMPLVMRSLFGTVAQRLPDRSLWSTYQDAFTFTEIAPSMTRPPGGKSAAAPARTPPLDGQ